MKSTLVTFLAILIFASVGMVDLVHAQDDEIGKWNIPFDFYAGAQKMPAGRYSIKIDLEHEVITFANASSGHRTFLLVTPADENNEQSSLVFEHSGDVYALEELKSDAHNLVFRVWIVPPIESRNTVSHVEVALKR